MIAKDPSELTGGPFDTGFLAIEKPKDGQRLFGVGLLESFDDLAERFEGERHQDSTYAAFAISCRTKFSPAVAIVMSSRSSYFNQAFLFRMLRTVCFRSSGIL